MRTTVPIAAIFVVAGLVSGCAGSRRSASEYPTQWREAFAMQRYGFVLSIPEGWYIAIPDPEIGPANAMMVHWATGSHVVIRITKDMLVSVEQLAHDLRGAETRASVFYTSVRPCDFFSGNCFAFHRQFEPREQSTIDYWLRDKEEPPERIQELIVVFRPKDLPHLTVELYGYWMESLSDEMETELGKIMERLVPLNDMNRRLPKRDFR